MPYFFYNKFKEKNYKSINRKMMSDVTSVISGTKSRNYIKKKLRSKNREDDKTVYRSRSLNSPNLSIEDRVSNQCDLDHWDNTLFINKSNIKKNILSISKASKPNLPIIQNLKMGRQSFQQSFNSIKSSPTRARKSDIQAFETLIDKYQSTMPTKGNLE